MTKTISGYKELPNFVEQISLGEFLPAHYRIRVALIVQNREILFETEEFDVTHAESIARPWIYSQLLAAADDPVYAHIIGQQFFNSGKIHEALKFVENAYNKNPESREFGEGLSRIYRELKEHDKIVSLLEPLMRLSESPSFEVHVLLGESYRELGNHEKAIEVFDKAIRLYGVNTLVLNALGGVLF